MNKYSVIISAFLLASGVLLSPDSITTGSFLTAVDSVRNTMYVGENIIEVEEDFDPPSEAIPGESFRKSPKIRNTGNTPCAVRVRVDFSDSAVLNLCEPLCFNDGWDAAPDGFLYWHKELLPGEATAPVFERISFRPDADPDGLSLVFNKGFRVFVYAESAVGGFHN